jgi:hypothetical protein
VSGEADPSVGKVGRGRRDHLGDPPGDITAIRDNTDRILELLESGRGAPARQAAPPPPDH